VFRYYAFAGTGGRKSGALAVDQDQKQDAYDHRDYAVPGPADVSGHEAAGEDIDSLKDLDQAHEDG
jgi:hypothetical protein